MERLICLDGVTVRLDVDRVEVDLHRPGLQPADHPDGHYEVACCNGDVWHPIMSFDDGTTVYLHCPEDGADGPLGYKVDGPRPHRWHITFLPDDAERVARLSWEAI
jgi:hypothetical protein